MSAKTGKATKKPAPSPLGVPSQPARRWFRFGPATLIAALAAVGILLWERGGVSDAGPQIIPQSAHTRVAANPASSPLAHTAPDPDWIWERRDTLRLAPKSTASLEAAHARWVRETQSLKDALDSAAREFGKAAQTPTTSGASLQTLQQKAGPVSELSRQFAEMRIVWWESASAFLDAAQRRQLQDGWLDHLRGMDRRLP